MTLKPWYKVIFPRQDLREGKPLDASEFAVHLDQVRDGRAPSDYQQPQRFFERTFLTHNLTGLAVEVMRRLSGYQVETSAIFNMATAFGGGKTHALTLLYHLASAGPAAAAWTGVPSLLNKANLSAVPQAAVAVFVGTEFDSITGRGGDDGSPRRFTPWGEIAYQLGGPAAFAHVAQHDHDRQAPAGDVIRQILPPDRPALILIDELLNYASRNRKSGLTTQLYNFIQNLSETARGQSNVALVAAIPASELQMTAEDQADHHRFKMLLDRLGKAVIMAAETETAEIIRRRLFEWDPHAVSQDGRVLIHRDALQTCAQYADWVLDHRQQLPGWFPIDNARDAFAAAYPFHPTLLSVFERKWQSLPRFQQTRGILRLLALWVSHAYERGFKGAHHDPLIGLGTAPLEDPLFRAAVFEQLGESRLEGAVTTDICGKKESHAVRLDDQAQDAIRVARLHRKVATIIFFESNGGVLKKEATIPEVRLAAAEPDLDIGNIETALESLSAASYHLLVERNRYRFSLSPNLNQMLADRRAGVQAARVDERLRAEIQKVFNAGPASIARLYYPEQSAHIPDRAALTLIVLAPDHPMQDKATLPFIESLTRQHGASGRTFKSALIWAIADDDAPLRDEARKTIAWEDIQDQDSAQLDDVQHRQLEENIKKAYRDLKESVWRAYKFLILLGKDNALRSIDLGLVHSSAAATLTDLILHRLRSDGDIEDSIGPNFLLRNWPPAFVEWSTQAVRDVFYASPQYPRLLRPDAIKDTIARGVSDGRLAYLGKTSTGDYQPFIYNTPLTAADVEISPDAYIITAQTAQQHLQAAAVLGAASPSVEETEGKHTAAEPGPTQLIPDLSIPTVHIPPTEETKETKETEGEPSIPLPPFAKKLTWTGQIPTLKWMNFYTKVLSSFATSPGLTLTLTAEIAPPGGLTEQKVQEIKTALRELGLNDDLDISHP